MSIKMFPLGPKLQNLIQGSSKVRLHLSKQNVYPKVK